VLTAVEFVIPTGPIFVIILNGTNIFIPGVLVYIYRSIFFPTKPTKKSDRRLAKKSI
jgi:hypothetical protein